MYIDVSVLVVGNLQDFEDYYLTKIFGEHREVLTELRVVYAVDMAMNFLRDLLLVISFLPNLVGPWACPLLWTFRKLVQRLLKHSFQCLTVCRTTGSDV